ncbi:MAG TPA: hypothetical protein VFY33_05380, partial [Solirubrobacterales bacterium]|nr:hypothetical protein [Solirubrobacterales bacterium]
MANRRRNLFILSFVAALVVACLIAIATKPTVLGLDLEGGTELIYQGRPTPQNPDIQSDDIDRAIEIIRKRTDALGVAEPEISRIGQDSIRVGLPNVENAEQAINQVGQTAQLYLYDWEPNAIGNPAKTNVPRGEAYFDRYYDAVKLGSQQQPECFKDECTTSGPSFYLFNSQTKEWIAGPAEDEADLLAQANVPDGKQPPNTEILT